MVLLVNILVENTVMQASVEPVVPGVLSDEEQGQVKSDFPPRRERSRERDTNLLTQRVEKPDGKGLDQEVRNQHRLEALQLLLVAGDLSFLDLVLVEVRNAVDDGPGQTATKIHDFVHQEEKETRGEQVVVHPVVVGGPELLDIVQVRHLGEVVQGI